MLERTRFDELVEGWYGKSIVVIGDIMLDHYRSCSVERVCPEAPVVVAANPKHSYFLGGAANVANNLEAMDVKVHLIGVVGDDDEGERLIRCAVERNIGIGGLYKDRRRPTTVKERTVSQNHLLLRVDTESKEDLHATTAYFLLSVLESILSLPEQPRAIIISDYAKGVCTEQLIKGIFACASLKQIPVFVDPTVRNFRRFAGAQLIKPNKKEAEALLGFSIDDSADSYALVARRFHEEFGCPMLITLGERGILVCDAESASLVRTEALNVFDVSGAGDTAMAMIAASRIAGATLQECAELANVASGAVVKKFGTAACSMVDLRLALTGKTA